MIHISGGGGGFGGSGGNGGGGKYLDFILTLL